MRIVHEIYDYIDKDEQYADANTDHKRVVAQYVKAENPAYRGIPQIEALPPYPLTMDECEVVYFKDLLDNNCPKERKLSREERKACVKNLLSLRLPLSFVSVLEREFHDALTASYARRYQEVDPDVDLSDYYTGIRPGTCGKLMAQDEGAAIAGFTLTGKSGCGKSSALAILLDRYPQVIEHPQTQARMTQITYLVVTCSANSNFNALYISIGAAIDKALGLITGVYERMIASKRSVGEMAIKVRELIETFAIGIIIFDEVQQLNFKGTNKHTFESLLTLSNSTKMGIAVVGTDEALRKMQTNIQTKRRVGIEINADKYCRNRDFFEYIFDSLKTFQWFDEYIEFDDAFKDALFYYSRGIVERIVSLYIYLHLEYLSDSNITVVDEKLLKKVVDKYYKGLDELLKDKEHQELNEERMEKIAKDAHKRIEKNADSTQYEQSLAETGTEVISDIKTTKRRVIENIVTCCPGFEKTAISKAFDEIYKKKTNQQLSEGELSQLTLLKLLNSKTVPRRRINKQGMELCDMTERLSRAREDTR